MTDSPERQTGTGAGCIHISLQPRASYVKTADKREIPFVRAVLTIDNGCGAEVTDFLPRITLGQEGGTVQEVSSGIKETLPLSIPAGGILEWDVYDLLIPAHTGSAAKIHMFGYRAALNWRFELEVSAEYSLPASSVRVNTPVSRWALRWSVPNPADGAVELTIENL